MKYLLGLALLITSQAWAQVEVEKFFNDKTKIENPMELRDPFRAPVFKTIKEKIDEKVTRDPEEVLASVNVSELRVHGVFIGKERRAVVRVGNEKGPPVIIKEGYRIGPDRVEVKAILPGGIILVEKMVNVYGQEEYLETVIPISK